MTSFYGDNRKINVFADEEENQISRANIDKWIFRLLLLLIGFMPLIVLAHIREVITPVITNIGSLTSGSKGDIFTYYKSILILIITIITGLLLIIKIYFMNGTIRKTVLNYFIGIFVLAIIVSTIMSPNISIALSGQYNRSDGALSWLCYIALMFIAMNINYPKKAVNYILYSLYPFIYINLFIITMNFTGNDLMQKEWVQKIVTILLPDGTGLSEDSQLVGTLNQWNYMSGMFAIMTVMFLAAAIIEKHWMRSILNTLTATVSIAIMLMSISTSGFITVLAMFIPILVLLYKVENKTKGIILVTIFLVLSGILIHSLSKEDPRVWTESVGFFTEKNPYIEEQQVSKVPSKINLSIFDKAYASDKSFELPVLPEQAVGPGSGRLYIWVKTIDILKQRPLFGFGLDTLMYNFPHNNIDARANMYTEYVIVDKPHNIYMGILYGTGIIGFISFLLLVGFTFLKSMINLFRNNNIYFMLLSFAVISYFIQAVFNDSLPGISAVIWIFIGMMFAFIFAEKEEEEINS